MHSEAPTNSVCSTGKTVTICGQDVLAGLDASADVFAKPAPAKLGRFVRVPKAVVASGGLRSLQVTALRAYVCLSLKDSCYWLKPSFGGDVVGELQEGQYLLWQRQDGLWGLLLPLVDGDVRTVVTSDGEGGISLSMSGALPGAEPESATACFVGLGSDPYKLTRDAMRAVSRRLGTFRPREDKTEPSCLDYWGWCTWNAFYGDVTQEKVLAGLKSFQAGIMPGFIILDDGWEDREEDFLLSLEPAPHRFPQGLAPLVDKAKREFGVKVFGLHLILQGYWSGISPNGPLGKEYTLVRNRGCIRPWEGADAGIRDLQMLVPQQAQAFWHRFQQRVRSWGVDMIKVDGQAGLHLFSQGHFGRGSTMAAYQQALQTPAADLFGNNLIHCMCHGSDIAYHMQQGNIWRTSDDFFPNRPDSHGAHLQCNALNSVWASTFVFCDWDMFWSRHPQGAFHAAARAISGGPVYVSDCPGETDFELIRKLVLSGGRVIRCAEPALPSPENLLHDACREDVLLKVANRNGGAGVLGLFNCRHDSRVEDTYGVASFPRLEGESFAVWCHNAQTLQVVSRSQRLTIGLEPLGFELAQFVPIRSGIACLGLLDKFNSTGACRITWRGNVCSVKLADGGRVGFYCERAPELVRISGVTTTGEYNAETGLLVLDLPPGRPHNIRVRMQRPRGAGNASA